MSPTTPQRFSASGDPSPYLREHARMQASTASACLRRLSDWVNSVRSCQAACRMAIDPSPKTNSLSTYEHLYLLKSISFDEQFACSGNSNVFLRALYLHGMKFLVGSLRRDECNRPLGID